MDSVAIARDSRPPCHASGELPLSSTTSSAWGRWRAYSSPEKSPKDRWTVVSIAPGAVMAPRWTYIDPAIAFNPMISFQVVIMAMLGGAGSLFGPVLGLMVYIFTVSRFLLFLTAWARTTIPGQRCRVV